MGKRGAIIYGQSNARGLSDLANLATILNKPAKNSRLWRGSANGIQLIDPSAGISMHPIDDLGATKHGPIISMAWEHENLFPGDELTFFSVPVGGRPLLPGSLPQQGCFDPQENQWQVFFEDEWERFISALTAEGEAVTWDFMYWNQGEADWDNEKNNPGLYIPAFKRVIAAMRRLTCNPELKVIIGMPGLWDSQPGRTDIPRRFMELAIEDPLVAVTRCDLRNFYGTGQIIDVAFDLVHLRSNVQVDEGIRAARIAHGFRKGGIALPVAVSNLQVSNEVVDGFDLSWTDSGSEEYVIAIDDVVYWSTRNTSYQVTGLDPSTTYDVKVYSKNLVWDVAFSQIQATTTAV